MAAEVFRAGSRDPLIEVGLAHHRVAAVARIRQDEQTDSPAETCSGTGTAVIAAPSHAVRQPPQRVPRTTDNTRNNSRRGPIRSRGNNCCSRDPSGRTIAARKAVPLGQLHVSGAGVVLVSTLRMSSKASLMRPSSRAQLIGDSASPAQRPPSLTWGCVTSLRPAAGLGSRATTSSRRNPGVGRVGSRPTRWQRDRGRRPGA